MSSQLIELVKRYSVHGMMFGKDYGSSDMVFSFICAFQNKAAAYMEDEELTKGNCCDLSC